MPLPNLNNQLLLYIFAYLPLTSYASLILTCQRFHSLVANNQSLFKTWCITKFLNHTLSIVSRHDSVDHKWSLQFPNYITSTTPLPDGLDYKWLLKCLHHNISKVQDPNTRTHGYIHNPQKLHIRSISSVSTSEHGTYVISQGIEVLISSMTYRIGTWVNGKLQGKGVFTNQFETYTGEFENDRYEGLGTITYSNVESYRGYFHNGCMNGYGTYKYEDSSSYAGGWYLDNKSGHGTHQLACGSSYVGQFNANMYHGLGTFTECLEGKVVNTHTGMWLYHVPIGCEFGHVFYRCRDCKLNLCYMCTLSNHRKCYTRKKWSIATKAPLDCKHEKQELSKIK